VLISFETIEIKCSTKCININMREIYLMEVSNIFSLVGIEQANSIADVTGG
jgi:hypothetical protein